MGRAGGMDLGDKVAGAVEAGHLHLAYRQPDLQQVNHELRRIPRI